MQRPISDIRRPIAAVIAVMGLATTAPGVSRGAIIFYTSRPSFNAAVPGLPVESFGAANMFGQAYITHASPISSATNDAVFAAGSILPGISVTTLNPGLVSTALEIQGGASGPKNVGTNWFQDTLILNFAPVVSAVGEDVFGDVYPGPSFAGSVTEQVFNGTTPLGSTSINEAAGTIGFIGVTSTTANITSVHLLFNPTADVDSDTFVANVAFGPATAAVPEPSSFVALSALAAILSIGRLASIRRRTSRPQSSPGRASP